jgi:hypothetical protein
VGMGILPESVEPGLDRCNLAGTAGLEGLQGIKEENRRGEV